MANSLSLQMTVCYYFATISLMQEQAYPILPLSSKQYENINLQLRFSLSFFKLLLLANNYSLVSKSFRSMYSIAKLLQYRCLLLQILIAYLYLLIDFEYRVIWQYNSPIWEYMQFKFIRFCSCLLGYKAQQAYMIIRHVFKSQFFMQAVIIWNQVKLVIATQSAFSTFYLFIIYNMSFSIKSQLLSNNVQQFSFSLCAYFLQFYDSQILPIFERHMLSMQYTFAKFGYYLNNLIRI